MSLNISFQFKIYPNENECLKFETFQNPAVYVIIPANLYSGCVRTLKVEFRKFTV